MKKLSITMYSSADKVAGQGVGSAYKEQVRLVKEGASDLLMSVSTIGNIEAIFNTFIRWIPNFL